MQYLRARLTAAGFPDVTFRIITSKINVNLTGVQKLQNHAGDIPVIQEPQTADPSWQPLLDGGIDNVLVIDRCGRLAYQVISPWSLINYPYVKAAILSTYKDDPCGPCNITNIKVVENDNQDEDVNKETVVTSQTNSSEFEAVTQPTTQIEETIDSWLDSAPTKSSNITQTSIAIESSIPESSNQTNNDTLLLLHEPLNSEQVKRQTSNTSLPEHDVNNELDATLSPLVERKDGTVPITVIIPSNHTHRRDDGTLSQHEYIVLQTGNPAYHGHLQTVPSEESDWKEKEKGNNMTLIRSEQHNSLNESTSTAEENENPVEEESSGHKGKKHKSEAQESNEHADENVLEKSNKNRKNKIKTHKEGDESIEIIKNRGKKIKIKVKNQAPEETQQSDTHKEDMTMQTANTDERSTETESEEIKGKYDSTEEVPESSDVSQDIRKHGKHNMQSTELNKIKHTQKSERYHTTQKAIQIVIPVTNGTEPADGLRNATISKNITVQEDKKQNLTSKIIKKTDTYKKIYMKKNSHKAVVSENENYTTEIPPTSNEKEMKGNLNTAYHIDEHHTGSESEDNLKRIEEVAVVTDVGGEQPGAGSSEENENDGKYEDIIKHYSKLIKWLDYAL